MHVMAGFSRTPAGPPEGGHYTASGKTLQDSVWKNAPGSGRGWDVAWERGTVVPGSERGPVALPVFKIGRSPFIGEAGFDSQALPPLVSGWFCEVSSRIANDGGIQDDEIPQSRQFNPQYARYPSMSLTSPARGPFCESSGVNSTR